jgi:hypothetical protein
MTIIPIGDYLVVPMPENEYASFYISGSNWLCGRMQKTGMQPHPIIQVPQGYKLLGRLHKFSEEQYESFIVKWQNHIRNMKETISIPETSLILKKQ